MNDIKVLYHGLKELGIKNMYINPNYLLLRLRSLNIEIRKWHKGWLIILNGYTMLLNNNTEVYDFLLQLEGR